MASIKVSIIVPVYNVEAYLRECLDSLVSQTLKDIEIICVNDGSTDSSPDILREYAGKDSRIVVIDKPNGGYGHTMNRGFERATGEYIGIVESDDFVAKSMYADLYSAARKYDCDIVKSDFNRFETVNGRILPTYVPLTDDRSWYDRVIDPKKEPLCLKLKMNTWTGIYRREFILRFGIDHHETPGASYQDNGFFFKTMTQASSVRFVNKAYYMNRRDNPGSSVYDTGKVYAMNKEMAYIKEFLLEKGLWETFKEIYYFKLLSNYDFTYNRIARERKNEYLLAISEEFKREYESGDMDIDRIYTPNEAARVRILIDAPLTYEVYAQVHALEARNAALTSELAAIKNSASFKLARKLTALPRKVRDIIGR